MVRELATGSRYERRRKWKAAPRDAPHRRGQLVDPGTQRNRCLERDTVLRHVEGIDRGKYEPALFGDERGWGQRFRGHDGITPLDAVFGEHAKGGLYFPCRCEPIVVRRCGGETLVF